VTFTYTLPTGTPLAFANPVHRLRFLLRDTTQTPQSLQDEELGLLLAEWAAANGGSTDYDFYGIAAGAAESMADSFSGAASTSKAVGDVSLSSTYSGQAERYRQLARRLGARSTTGGPGVMRGMGLAGGAAAAARPSVFTLGALDNGNGGTPGSSRTNQEGISVG
jgi:hypothetical protein